MSFSVESPKDFEFFLQSLVEKGEIQSFWIISDTSLEGVRARLSQERAPWISRTHKKGRAGPFWGVEIFSRPGSRVGVDLEIFDLARMERMRQWLGERFAMPSDSSARQVLEEWCVREAAFKAASGYEAAQGLVLSDFVRIAGEKLLLPGDPLRSFEVNLIWSGDWVLSVAVDRRGV